MMKKTALLIFIASNALFASSAFSQEKQPSKLKENWKVHIEAGGTISKGNSKQESVYSKNDIDYKKDKWTEILRTRLENTKNNNQRIKERYDVNNQLRYNFTEKNYRFFEAEYIDDRFAGYDYRASMTYGYGRNLIQNKKHDLSSQISAGARKSKFTNSEAEESLLLRVSGNYVWTIKEDLVFSENLDVSWDEEVVITKSESSLRVKLKTINHSLYFKLGYFIENRSNTPSSDVKKTDSTIMTMIGYNF